MKQVWIKLTPLKGKISENLSWEDVYKTKAQILFSRVEGQRPLFKKGENDKAREQLEKALSIDENFPGSDEARKVLAEL